MKVITYNQDLILFLVKIFCRKSQILYRIYRLILQKDSVCLQSMRDKVVVHSLGFADMLICTLSTGYNHLAFRMIC